MASGVKVSEDVKKLYKTMKVVKNDDEEENRIRVSIFKIKSDIEVDKVYRQKDLEGVPDVFEFVRSLLIQDQCCYMLYDCHFEIMDVMKKEELVFILWAPESSNIKEKMRYASSKNAISKVFDGVKHTLQMNDPSDHEKGCFIDQIDKRITTLEGHPVRETCAKGAKGVKGVKGQ